MTYSKELFKKIQTGTVSGLYPNNSGATITAFTPVKMDSSANEILSDAKAENVKSLIGITQVDINDTEDKKVVTHGRLEGIDAVAGIATANIGQMVYLSSIGGLTTIVPSVNVNGFVSGDFVVSLGVLAKSLIDPAKVDLLINIDIVGQL